MGNDYEKDRHLGKELLVSCPGNCAGITNQEVVASVDVDSRWSDVNFWERHQIIMCKGCKTLSFRHVSGNSEEVERVGEKEWDSGELVTLYPNRTPKFFGLREDASKLPINVALLYKETCTALLNATPILSAIGLRALVETVCKQKKASGKYLYLQINSLVEMGVLTKIEADVLQKIRSIGNQSAHEATPHPDQQLFLAMEVVEHLLKSVYIIPFKLDKF